MNFTQHSESVWAQCLDLIKDLKIDYLSIANNHILDFKQSTKETISILEENNIGYLY